MMKQILLFRVTENDFVMLMGIIICLSLLIDTLDYMTNPRRH